MQIFVSGTWNLEKAQPFSQQGFELGKNLAISGYDLACGPGTGMARFVIDGYRSIEPRGVVRYYLPDRKEMVKVGEEIGEGADEIIETHADYPIRNILQVKASDGVIIITGGDGTLEEAITALADYNLPVACLANSGSAVKAIALLLDVFPSWKELVFIGENVNQLMDYINQKLHG